MRGLQWVNIKQLYLKIKEMLLDDKQLSEIKHEKTILEPSLDGGYSAIYHNRIPMEIKYVDYDRNVKQVGGAEMLLVKLYSYGSKINSNKIKLEVSSEYDPFLSLIFQCDIDKFGYLRQQQGINSNFQDFPTVLIKCFNKVEEQCCCRPGDLGAKGKLSLNLLVGSDGKARLVINQSSEYKNIEVFCLEMSSQNEQTVEQKVSYKYNEIRNKVLKAEERLMKIQQIIKQKNPTLLTQIFKTTQGQTGKLNISGI